MEITQKIEVIVCLMLLYSYNNVQDKIKALLVDSLSNNNNNSTQLLSIIGYMCQLKLN